MLRKIVFGKGSRWIVVVVCWVFMVNCTYAFKEEDLQKIGFIKVADSSSEGPAEENGSENNGTKKNDEAKQSRKYLDHLILGEADFSFTEALIRKHQKSYPDLPKHIIATDKRTMEILARGYPDTFFKHMAALHQLGMRYMAPGPDGKYPSFADKYDEGMIITGVDATRLREIFPVDHTGSTGFHFERIHFIFPNSRGYDNAHSDVIIEFFKSASQIQSVGDRIHVPIPRGWEHTYYSNIVNDAKGYRLIKKHRFANRSYLKISSDATEEILERYPGYVLGINAASPIHLMQENYKNCVHDAREYVFERIQDKSGSSDSEVETDDDSSDYLDDADGRWYTGDDMNQLMDHYFGRPVDDEERHPDTQDLGLGRMHVINVEALDGDVLRQNLIQRERAIYRQGVAVPRLLVPLNVGVGEGNHWVGLYINRMPDQDGIIQVFYFDSFGNPMPRRLQTILREIYISRGVVRFYQNNRRYQVDSCSCGAWVIEFFRAMHAIISKSLGGDDIEGLFDSGFRIDAAKEQHRAILHPNH